MAKGQRAARWLARQSGQIQPVNGHRRLRDGTEITHTEFQSQKGQAVVTGIAKTGSIFVIAVPLAAIPGL